MMAYLPQEEVQKRQVVWLLMFDSDYKSYTDYWMNILKLTFQPTADFLACSGILPTQACYNHHSVERKKKRLK